MTARLVVPVGWPCDRCKWTRAFPTPDGRIIRWRLAYCPEHQGAW